MLKENFGTTFQFFTKTEDFTLLKLQLIETTTLQDVIEDVVIKIDVIGYGYAEIIPAMTDPLNNGNDSTNENLHNYLFKYLQEGIASVNNSYFNNFAYIRIWIMQK